MLGRKQHSNPSRDDLIRQLKKTLDDADAIVLGAGPGMSTAAGFIYTGERFQRYFSDFSARYGFQDMYSGGFYPFPKPEEFWAYWSRYIYINRYMDAPSTLYRDTMELIRGKDYFILTTNVDHCFQKAGADKERLFYTQGDYGLFQCSEPCHQRTYDNADAVRKMVEAQGFVIAADGTLSLPKGIVLKTEVPTGLVPHCPRCGKPMTMNLRADDTFVQDAGWDIAAQRYRSFLDAHTAGKIVYLEIGVGFNTPGIIKYPFWQRVYQNEDAIYVCLNATDAAAPTEIKDRSICIDGDSASVVRALLDP